MNAMEVPLVVGSRPGRAAAPTTDAATRFRQLIDELEPRVRRALVGAYGPDTGSDAAADAFAWAWTHLERVEGMENPAGYLYRVGQSSARRVHRRRRFEVVGSKTPDRRQPPAEPLDPGLERALDHLTDQQRVAVVLVHGYGYPLMEAAEVLDTSVSTLRNHIARGMDKLRTHLGGPDA